MAPAREVRTLRYAQSDNVPNGDSYECELVFSHENADGAGIAVRVGDGEETVIRYDAKNGELVFDATKSGSYGRRIEERAPFRLDEGEELHLDVFVDKSIIEVYANERQAIARHIYPSGKNPGCAVIGEAKSVMSWKMMEANPY